MNEFTPLSRPLQSQVSIDSVAKECPSENFNYPTFRQLNKKSRVFLSTPLNPQSSSSYHLFSVANSRGWFVAVKAAPSGSELVFSPLEELRSALVAANQDDETLFNPKRVQSIPTKANIVEFACDDTRLLVGLEDGSVISYDTSLILTPGTNDIQPLRRTQVQSSPLRQILPNPGTEHNLSEIIAIVGDGKVQLLNSQLEPQGGWAATDLMTQPIAVDWSPKGKHIAIGLQTGDILTFSLTNKSTPNKHIPPTVNSILVSLNWLGPSHTFRTSYAAQGDSPATQHIITLDTKSSTATYIAPDHPFPLPDRNNQVAYVVCLPKWDSDPGLNEDNKSLTIVGDVSSVDLEILGNVGNQWYRQSQENPLSLPLDKSMDDTILLALEVDLTDAASGVPIMYAYLNDGSLQGWYAEHTKPYLGMSTRNTTSSTLSNQIPIESQQSKDTDMGSSTEPALPATAFGQSSFGQQSQSPFGQQQTSAFGQTGFGQQPTSSGSTFGQSSFGQSSAFGSMSGGFGQSNQSNATTSAFGSTKPAAGFSAFGSSSTGAFGSGSAFSGLSSNGTSNAFGSGTFGAPISNNGSTLPSSNMTREASMSDSTPGFGGLSLGSATPSDPNAVNSMFGTFSATPSTAQKETTSAFGSSTLKPATGFGAFGSYKSTSAFEPTKPSETTTAFSAPPQSQSSATSGFGQSGFAAPSFGKSAFGQPSFGQSTPPATSTTTAAPIRGGFGAFSNTPVSFGGAAQQQKASAFGSGDTTTPPSSGGFGAFASTGPVTLGTALPSVSNTTQPQQSIGSGFGAFASKAPSAFGPASLSNSPSPDAFGSNATSDGSKPPPTFLSQPATEAKPRTSVFGTSTSTPTSSGDQRKPSNFGSSGMDSPTASPTRNSFAPSPPSSPEPTQPAASPFGNFKSTTPFGNPSTPVTPSPGGAFSNIQVTPSVFKPASGFGAFGGLDTPKSSPFFKKPDETTTPISAFAHVSTTPKTPTTSTTTAFGSPSVIGGAKSAFAPVTPTAQTTMAAPTSGGFSAFGGNKTGFSDLSRPKTSFSDLLKGGGENAEKSSKSVAVFGSDGSDGGQPKPQSSVFGTPVTADEKAVPSASSSLSRQKTEEYERKDEKSAPESEVKSNPKSTSTGTTSDDASHTDISASSTMSSFVEVGAEQEENATLEEGELSDEDAEHSGDDRESFLSDNFSESSYKDGDSANEDSEDDLSEDEEPSPDPTSVPLPSTRSPSATPQPEPPTIEVSPSPDDNGDKSNSSKKSPSPVREPSTTPPGTPVKEPKSLFGPNPTPATTPGGSSLGFGLGRPSTRPTRSSPLANAVSVDEEEETPTRPVKPIPSPKPTFALLPIESETKEKDEATDGIQPSSNKRPKTPPLLSTLPPPPVPRTPILAPAIPHVMVSQTPNNPGGVSGLPFSFAAPPAAPAPSFFRAASETQGPSPALSKPDLPRAATAPPPALTSLFGTAPQASSTSGSLKSGFGMTPFSFNNTASPSLFTPGAPSIFGAASQPLAPAPQFGGGPFTKTATTAPPHTSFGAPASGSAPVKSKASPTLAQTPPGPTPESIIEEGMQKECVNLVEMVNNDLNAIRELGKAANAKQLELGASAGGSRHKADLGVAGKWSLGDLTQFRQVLLQYEADLEVLTTSREEQTQTLREIQSSMLKAGTRKEEITRFNKAKDDKEFARILKARSLGPEHSEKQAHLRKTIRVIRDRVQKLESGLQENKKRLTQATTCKPTFKPPTLDTINRTYRNIEIAIEQQSNEVERLASRVAKIQMNDRVDPPVSRDARLPDIVKRRASFVTPNIAETTAAALNSERSAYRLKKALLSVRKEPLLNKQVAYARPAPQSFETPQKPSITMEPFAFEPPMSGGRLFGEPFTPTPIPGANWQDIPEDNFNPTPSPISVGRRGATGQRKHQSVPLKRSTGTAVSTPTPPPSGFEWGPLPAFPTPPPSSGLPSKFVPFSIAKK